MTASAISSEHGTRRNFVSVLSFKSESTSLGEGDSEKVREALVCEEDVEN